jgi:hypothetical protein
MKAIRKHIGFAQGALAALATGLLLLAGCATSPETAVQSPVQPAMQAEEAASGMGHAMQSAASQPVSYSHPSTAHRQPAEGQHPEEIRELWGVQIEGLRWTSGGYMLDFRFRVLDAQKAAPLFIRQTKPYLVDVRTGATFLVPSPPKTGPLRTSNMPQEGRVYWMFFANPAQNLKPGDLATVVIGDFQAQDLVVE